MRDGGKKIIRDHTNKHGTYNHVHRGLYALNLLMRYVTMYMCGLFGFVLVADIACEMVFLILC